MGLGLVQLRAPLSTGCLPELSEGFNIRLDEKDWAALFPRHHFMWVSPDFRRTRDFVRSANRSGNGYGDFLSPMMRDSFEQFYSDPAGDTPSISNPLPKGQVLDNTVCFLPTNDCNLGCRYCFSGAEPRKFGVIPWEIAKAAIDLGTRNAVLSRIRNGHGILKVAFYGGGEPTEYWERFSGIVEYARSSAAKCGIDVAVGTLTNGQIDESQWDWFRTQIDDITVSMDGPRDIQDAQRPMASGASSFDKSWRFLSAMADAGKEVRAIRITVTAQSVCRMAEIAEFFWDSLAMAYPLQFEPVYFSEVGRQQSDMPTAHAFVANFRAVEELARRRKADREPQALVGTATRPLAIRGGAYCDSLEGRGLFVTPNGYLSLCSEVSSPADPRKDDYYIGGYDASTKQFHITPEGTSKIRCGPPWWCRGCFAQFSCRGGCEPRSQNTDHRVRKWWCQMVRQNIRNMWGDVRANKVPPQARIGDPQGEELIWLPKWYSSPSMEM